MSPLSITKKTGGLPSCSTPKCDVQPLNVMDKLLTHIIWNKPGVKSSENSFHAYLKTSLYIQNANNLNTSRSLGGALTKTSVINQNTTSSNTRKQNIQTNQKQHNTTTPSNSSQSLNSNPSSNRLSTKKCVP